MKTPFKYLGCLPVGGFHKRDVFWVGVLDKIESKLSSWKGRFLSLAGKICLFKFVLSPIPLFYVSLYKVFAMVLNEIVKLQRNFLWSWGSEERKIARVSWKKVCEPLDVGGLDIMDIRLFNSALLGKWIWRLHSHKGGLWKQILESKYGGWRSLKESRVYNKDSLWWRDLKGI